MSDNDNKGDDTNYTNKMDEKTTPCAATNSCQDMSTDKSGKHFAEKKSGDKSEGKENGAHAAPNSCASGDASSRLEAADNDTTMTEVTRSPGENDHHNGANDVTVGDEPPGDTEPISETMNEDLDATAQETVAKELSGEDESDSRMESDVRSAEGAATTEGKEDRESSSSTDTGEADDVRAGDDSSPVMVIRPGRRRVVSKSSSSDDTEDDYNGERDPDDDEGESSSSEEDEPPGEQEPPPPDTLRVIRELRRREVGYSNKHPSVSAYNKAFAGSVSLVQRLQQEITLDGHDGCVNALHFNKSGTLIASGSDDLNIVLWNWLESRPYIRFDSGHKSNVFQSKFVPYVGDTHVVSCARDGQVRLAELSSTGVCKGTRRLAQHRGAAHKLALLQDSSHVFLSAGEDAVTFELDLRQDKPNKICVTKEEGKKIELYSIAANPSNSFEFCTGGRDYFIRIYDRRNINEGKPVKKFTPHPMLFNKDNRANVTCAVYSYNGAEVLGTYNDEDIYLFDSSHSDGANFVKQYTGHRNNATVKGVNFYGPRSEFVVSGSDCGNVYLWEKSSQKVVNFFHADEGGVINVLEPHPSLPVLATSGLDSDIKVWTPTAAEPCDLSPLRKLMRRNHRTRETERSQEPDDINGQVLWFLMQQLRRTSRRRRSGSEGSSGISDSEVDLDDADSDEDSPAQPAQCAQS